MPKTRTTTPRTPRHAPISDVDRHLEEWIETLEEMQDLSDDDLEALMKLVTNDNKAADDD